MAISNSRFGKSDFRFLKKIAFVMILCSSVMQPALADYTLLESITATGAQRVRTGYTPACTDRIEMKIRFTNISDTMTLWCSRSVDTKTATVTAFLTGGKLRFDRNNTVGTAGAAVSAGTDYVIVADYNTRTVTLNGAAYSQTMGGTGAFNAGSELGLFASHYSGIDNNIGNYAKYTFYYLKIYDVDGNLVHAFYPAKDNDAAPGSVGQYGVLDLCDISFKATTKNTAFTSSNVVKTENAAGTECRWNSASGKFEYRVVFSADSACTVNGSPVISPVWVSDGALLSLTALPPEGYSMGGWMNAPSDATVGIDGSLTHTVKSPVQVKPWFAFVPQVTRAATGLSSRSYVTDGLALQWDGLYNVSHDQPHDGNATKWTDLTGNGHSFTLDAAHAFVNGNALSTDHTHGSDIANSADLKNMYINADYSVEVAYDMPSSSTNLTSNGWGHKKYISISFGADNAELGILNGTSIGVNANGLSGGTSTYGCLLNIGESAGQHAYSVRQGNSHVKIDADGRFSASFSVTPKPESYSFPNSPRLNRERYWDKTGMEGLYHSVRVYRRSLGDDETAANIAVDQVRFLGADATRIKMPDGWHFAVNGATTNLYKRFMVSTSNPDRGLVAVNGGALQASVGCEGVVGSELSADLLAVPATGCVFDHWHGIQNVQNDIAEMTANFDYDVQAVFYNADDLAAKGIGFTVTGSPAEYGVANVSYGTHLDWHQEDQVSISVSKVWTNAAETVAAVCRGYRLDGKYCGTSSSATNALDIAYTAEYADATLTWLFDCDYKFTAESDDAEKGTVSLSVNGTAANGASVWAGHGDTVRFIAVPNTGYSFVRWDGDVDDLGNDQIYSATLDIPAAGPKSLTAVFKAAGTYNVPGDFATVAEAIADETVTDGDTIQLGIGKHPFDAFSVTKSVKILGSSTRGETIIDLNGVGGITLDAPGAYLAGVTITNFSVTADGFALYVLQGWAHDIYIDGRGSEKKQNMAAVKIASSGYMTDSDIYSIRPADYNLWSGYGNRIEVTGGTVRRTKFRSLYTFTTANVGASMSNGKRPLFEDCEFLSCSNYAWGLGSFSNADLVNCVISNCAYRESQGGMNLTGTTTLNRCRIHAFSVWNNSTKNMLVLGAGSDITFENCLISGNNIRNGAPIYLGTGGTVARFLHCTIADNNASMGVTGCFGGSGTRDNHNSIILRNTIVRGNTTGSLTTLTEVNADPAITYTDIEANCSAITDIVPTTGSGNFAYEPLYNNAAQGDYSQAKGSPCIDTGYEIGITEDIEGNERPLNGTGRETAQPDVGCYEAPATTVALECSISYLGEKNMTAIGTAPLRVLTSGLHQHGLSYRWIAKRHCADSVTEIPVVNGLSEYTFTGLEPGIYSFAVEVSNDMVPQDVATNETELVLNVFTATPCYVATDGSDEWPYSTPATAARKLSDVLTLAANEIRICPGTYQFEHFTDSVLSLDCIAYIDRKIKIIGSANRDEVVLDMNSLGGVIIDHPEAVFAGVTISNFMKTADVPYSAIRVYQGLVSNVCVECYGSASGNWGCGQRKVYVGPGGILADSRITRHSNGAWVNGAVSPLICEGGSVIRTMIDRCQINAATVSAYNSGTIRPQFINCIFAGNTSFSCSVGSFTKTDFIDCIMTNNAVSHNGFNGAINLSGDCMLSRCRIIGNYCSNVYKDVYIIKTQSGTSHFENCLIARNTNYLEPISCGANGAVTEFVNCTVIGNKSTASGKSGCFGGSGTDSTVNTIRLINTIVRNNTNSGNEVNFNTDATYTTIDASYSAVKAGEVAGTALVTANPALKADYMLSASSPCRGAGDNLDWTRNDLDLNLDSRLIGSKVDIGCFECHTPFGTMLIMH